ncbi:MAG: hypothetical protein ACOC95_08625 [Planctomycetota bacterium]
MVTGLLSLTMAATAAGQAVDDSQLPIAIQSYIAEKDPRTGEAWRGMEGYRIVHRDFDVELEDRIIEVPILGIQKPGKHYATVEARAKSVAERLVHALDMMKEGGSLIVMRDNWNAYRLEDDASNAAYGVFLTHRTLPTAPLRIITLYPEDVDRFPFVSEGDEQPQTDVDDLRQTEEYPLDKKQKELTRSRDMAEYVKSIIEAHYTLFWKRSGDIREYEALLVDLQTHEGRIFKEIFIRAQERTAMMDRSDLTAEDIKDALSRVAMSQRYRLVRMAIAAPRDWPDREEE